MIESMSLDEVVEYLRRCCGSRAKFLSCDVRAFAGTANRTLPAGMWKRGNVYYTRFRKKGRLIQKRLSPDFETACSLLKVMRAKLDSSEESLELQQSPVAVTVFNYGDRRNMVLGYTDPITGKRRTMSSCCEDRESAEAVAARWQEILNGDRSLVKIREQHLKAVLLRRMRMMDMSLKVANSSLRLQKLVKELGE